MSAGLQGARHTDSAIAIYTSHMLHERKLSYNVTKALPFGGRPALARRLRRYSGRDA